MYKEIQQQFNKVLEYAWCIEKVNTDEIFSNWHKNKADFIKAFGGELIYNCGQVSFSLDDKSLEEIIESKVIRKFLNALSWDADYDHFIKYIRENYDAFRTNILARDYIMSPDKVIAAGIKFTKSFKFFIPDEDLLTYAQNLASEVIQKNKCTGTLCLSVHPLDFLSTSENAHNWHSCHALDGEYKLGNLSYMQDKSTIVCYIEAENGCKYKLPNFPEDIEWNSKKWRMLLYVSDNRKMIMAGRQYPFATNDALSLIRETYLNLFTKNEQDFWIGGRERDYWIDWQNQYIESVQYPDGDEFELYARYIALPGEIKRMRDLIIDVKPQGYEDDDDEDDTILHYNDLLRSTCYTEPYYCFYKYFTSDSMQFHIGHPVNCLICGEEYCREDIPICHHCYDRNNEEEYEEDDE